MGTGPGSQGGQDIEALLDPLELPAGTEPHVEALLDAWMAGDGDRSAGLAYSLAVLMRNEGQVLAAVELLDTLVEEFPSNGWLPLILAVRGDLHRHLGEFDSSERDLRQAEQLCTSSHYTRRLALQYARSFGVQLRIDQGLLSAAQERFREFEPLVEPLIQQTLDPDEMEKRGEPEHLARLRACDLRSSSAMRAYNLDMALWLHDLGAQGMRELLADELLQDDPRAMAEARSRLGWALIKLARDARDGLNARSPEELLAEARFELAGALETGLLNFEEELVASLGLIDVAWLSGDATRERELLAEVRDRPGIDPTPEQEARRAAYEARRKLEDRAPAEDLRRTVVELERAFDQVERTWMEADRPPEGLGFLHWDTQRLVVGLWIRLLLELEGPERGAEEALEVLTRVQAIGTLAQKLGASEVSFEQVRRQVPAGTGVLVFLPSLDESHLLAFDRGRVVSASLPSRRALQRVIVPVSRAMRTIPADRRSPAQAELHELAAQLFPAAVRELMDDRDSLVFVGASLMADPCLEALPFEGSTIGARFATSYLPALGTWVPLAARSVAFPADPGQVVVLAATGLAPPHELKLLDGERDRLRRLAGAKGARFGSDARLESTPNAGILAILGHGVYDPRASRPAGIAMPGGFIGCDALEDAALPPVVCLLSCGTARGPLLRGDDGTVHLGGAALVGGARTVLLARNDIETAASLTLFEDLVAFLRQGLPPDESLRRARTGLRDHDEAWADPFYTASLTLFGLGRPPAALGVEQKK